MRTTPDKFYDSGVQDWAKDVTKGVSETMMEGGNPLKRSWRGVKAVIRERTKSPWRDQRSVVQQSPAFRNLSMALRFVGKQRAAEWVDRFTATQYKIKDRDTQKQRDKTTDTLSTDVSGIIKEMRVQTGSLIRIESQIGILQAAVMTTQDDVRDIKSLIMPKDITVKGGAVKDQWGREDRSAVGQMRFAQYNPLAPAGMEFLKVSEKQLGGGFYTRGHVTSKRLEGGFIEDAMKKASIETAALVLKIQKKDQEKAELRKKNEYKDPKERKAFEANPLLALMDQMNARFDKLEELLRKIRGGDEDSTLEDIGEAAIGAAIGSAIPSLAAQMIRALPFLGIASIPGIALALATYWAKTADINNPGYNPLSWTGKLGKEFADWVNKKSGRTEEWEEGRKTVEQLQRENPNLRPAPPGYHYEGNTLVPDTGTVTPKLNDAQIEALKKTAETLRNAGKVDEAQRIDDMVSGAKIPVVPPSPPSTGGELRRKSESKVTRNPNTGIVMNVPPEAMAFLDAIAMPESEGKYDTIVGKGKFGGPAKLTNYNNHPAQAGVGIASNGEWVDITSPRKKKVSTAAGRYQITKTTWDELVNRYGFRNFSPQNQDQAAWYLAQERYKAETGMDLYDALKSGNKSSFQSIAKGLSKTWTSLQGGVESQSRGSVGATQSRYEAALPDRIAQSNSGIAPRMVVKGEDMDITSREVARGSVAPQPVASVQPIVISKTLPIMGTPSVLTLPTLSGMATDNSILNMADRNHSLA